MWPSRSGRWCGSPARATGSRPTSTSSTTEPPSGEPAARGPLLDVGAVTRPHGLRGEVVVHFLTNRPERTEVGARFSTDGGELVIGSLHRNGDRWVVHFEGVDTVEAAEALRGRVLRAEALDDPDALWVHELLGSQVVDASDGRVLGRVAAVVENPASDLLELEDGGLVPLRFVVAHEAGRVSVDIPAGLLD
ncbi:MAG TPA: ribosome maturation factor RimM [Acidimicrobiales bacterium]|nr:ribosome maturation factor RimM [Acidimicrobiales bacterium]